MNKQIIFLDIDGPLMPGKQWFDPKNSDIREKLGDVWWEKIKELEEFDDRITFDPIAVQFFNLWQRMSGAEIVVASNWRRQISKERLLKIFNSNGLDAKLHDDWLTPRRFTSNRINEIGMWMDDNPGYNGIIVDDDGDLCRYAHWFNDPEFEYETQGRKDKDFWEKDLHLVEVDYSNGLTLQNFRDGCEWLGIEQDDVMEECFGIKPLTDEEKAQRDADLELLVRCCI